MIIIPVSIGSFTGENCFGGYCPDENANGGKAIELIVTNVLGFLTIVAGLAFLIYFVLGAITWITAGGDSGNVDKAKKQMTNAAIGMIVIAASYAITWIIGTVLGIDILNPASIIDSIWPGGGGSTGPAQTAPPQQLPQVPAI